MNAANGHFTRAFEESVLLLLRLHELFKQGMAESSEADDVRDCMDRHWYAMEPRERELIGELSVDLYTISEPASKVETPLEQEFKESINKALRESRYLEGLLLLRKNESQLDASAASFLRGVCWSGLGVNAAAAEFFLHAEEKQPGTPDARLCALSTLISGHREREALQYVHKWAGESNDPNLVLKAAEVVFLNAVRSPGDTASHLYQQAIVLAEQALQRYEMEPSDPRTDQQVIVVLLQIAVSYARLGDIGRAREFCALARNAQS